MFDIGFSELLLCAVVALLVIGPERLPGAARKAGLWVAHLRRSFAAVKAEVEREIGADELRQQLHNDRILAEERLRTASEALQAPAFDAEAHNRRILEQQQAATLAAAPDVQAQHRQLLEVEYQSQSAELEARLAAAPSATPAGAAAPAVAPSSEQRPS